MNLLDKQSLSACLFAMKDFMEFVRVKEVFLTIFVLQLFAGSVFVCIDQADIHTNLPFSTGKAWIGEDPPDMLEREAQTDAVGDASGRREECVGSKSIL